MTRFFVVLGIAAAALSLAAAPALANNDFAAAKFLPYGVVDDTVSNASGGIEVGESLTSAGDADRRFCVYNGNASTFSQVDRTFWWRIVGSGRRVTVSTAGSTFDSHLGIFNGIPSDKAAFCFDGDPNEFLSFDTVAGQGYWIQVGNCAANTLLGGCGTTIGQIHVQATSPAAANDNRANAAELPTGQPTVGDNWAATEEAGEAVSCAGHAYGRTVWYRWRAPAVGAAVLAAGDPNAAIAVYSSAGAPLGCEAVPGGDARVSLNVTPGDYLVQVGGVGVHSGLNSDSASGSFNVQATFTENGDRDSDGAVNARDCRPDDPKIHPGAVDVPRNGVDEDCSGRDARYPRVNTRLFGFFTPFTDGRTRIDRIYVQRVSAGSRIVITCRGGGCPAKRKLRPRRVRKATNRINLDGALRARKLRPGARITLRITKKGSVGAAAVWTMRSRKSPKRQDRCTRPGASRLVSCSRV
jgi:hypothetical protein